MEHLIYQLEDESEHQWVKKSDDDLEFFKMFVKMKGSFLDDSIPLIKSEFGVDYHENYIFQLMRAINFSSQKPKKRLSPRPFESS